MYFYYYIINNNINDDDNNTTKTLDKQMSCVSPAMIICWYCFDILDNQVILFISKLEEFVLLDNFFKCILFQYCNTNRKEQNKFKISRIDN